MIHRLHRGDHTPTQGRRGWGRWLWLPVAALALVAAHGLVLSYVWVKWALVIGAGALVVMVLVHLGVFGSLVALFHQKRHGGEQGADTSDHSPSD